ncbi:DUF499 domain-containing protein [Thermotoga sp. RQ7]
MKHLIMTTARDMACQRVMDTVKEMYGKYGEDRGENTAEPVQRYKKQGP